MFINSCKLLKKKYLALQGKKKRWGRVAVNNLKRWYSGDGKASFTSNFQLDTSVLPPFSLPHLSSFDSYFTKKQRFSKIIVIFIKAKICLHVPRLLLSENYIFQLLYFQCNVKFTSHKIQNLH